VRSSTAARSIAGASLCIAAILCVFVLAAPAFGYNETTGTPIETPDDSLSHGELPGCGSCHPMTFYDCGTCHLGFEGEHGRGPHGNFIANDYMGPTEKCAMCHTLHGGSSPSVKLLPRATLGSSCDACHDGTGGYGVYGSLKARGLTPGAQHRIETATVVPGGHGTTGGDRTGAFRGQDGTLTCSDCHTPHGTANTMVNPFVGDRQRTTLRWQNSDAQHHVLASTKLLKRLPTGAAAPVSDYGSDWCLACHAGRPSGGSLHNHPVDSLVSTTTPFIYANVAVPITGAATRATKLLGMGGWGRPGDPWVDPAEYAGNRGYLMPYPRSTGAGGQNGHKPICQQCHEDSRDVGSLDATGLAITTPLQITHEDGKVATDNPRFQNFPHETENARFLVETADDLCLNCHPTGELP
jgi:hypothetical protein